MVGKNCSDETKKTHTEYMREYTNRPENKERINKAQRERYNNLTPEQREKALEYKKKHYRDNIEKIKEYKEEHKQEKKNYMAEYRKTDAYRKSQRITNWKKSGLKCDDFNIIYDKYININQCEECNVELIEGMRGANKKCLDHDHKTGLYRNIICHTCNVKRGFKDKLGLKI
jgi:hypothetical protein